MFEILDRVSNVPEPAKPVPLNKLEGELEFRHVGFRYRSGPPVENRAGLLVAPFSFEEPRGRTR